MQERVKIDMVENLSLSLYMEFARLAYDKNFVRLQHNQSYDQCIHIHTAAAQSVDFSVYFQAPLVEKHTRFLSRPHVGT
jgi:hypothetical protein